jgi:hypothetical protein
MSLFEGSRTKMSAKRQEIEKGKESTAVGYNTEKSKK